MGQPPSLIETMRQQEGTLVRGEAHLARLEASARALGYPWRPGPTRRALEEAAGRRGGPWRVRLLLPPDGRPTCEVRPLEPPRPEPVPVAMAREPVDGRDPWRRHKSTHRGQYDAATAVARRAGLADLLFLDEDGFLVEGAVSNVFVRIGNGLVTPPVGRGALPGVLRAELLTQRRAVEGDVTAKALADADEVWIGSSLRGLRRVRIVVEGGSVHGAAPEGEASTGGATPATTLTRAAGAGSSTPGPTGSGSTG